jgi:hypothetical protein
LQETFTQDPNQISRLDIVTPNVPKVNYNFNAPATVSDSAEESSEQNVQPYFGQRIPPQEHQQSSSVIISPDSTDSPLFFVIETKIQATENYVESGVDGPQILVSPPTQETPGELLDPSFQITSAPSQASTEHISGIAPHKISQSQIRPKNSLDKEGWKTDGEVDENAPIVQQSTSVFDITLRETEAPKTVTYANEWSTYEEQPSKVVFIPQVRPKPSTNFEREWTVREDATIKPSRQYDTLLPVTSTAGGYAANSWQAFDAVTEPSNAGVRVEKDANPAVGEDASSIRKINGPYNFNAQRNPSLNNFKPSQEEGGKRPLVSRPIPPRPTPPTFRPPPTTIEEDEEEDEETLTTPNFPIRTNGHGPNFRPSQPQDTTEPPVAEFPVLIGPQLPENGFPATADPDIVVGRPNLRPDGVGDNEYRPLPTRPFPNRENEGFPPRPFNPQRPRRPVPPRRPPPPPYRPDNEYDQFQQFQHQQHQVPLKTRQQSL